MEKKQITTYREFLKDNIRMEIDFRLTDQSKGHPPPPLEKPSDPEKQHIDLIGSDQLQKFKGVDLTGAIGNRKSHRVFKNTPLSMEELAYLLWATQGVRQVVNAGTALRTVPSAGARHAFETYLVVLNVAELTPGIYRYLPLAHQLVFEQEVPDLRTRVVEATYGQKFTGKAAVSFVWSVIPYRMEWRYHLAAHKVILIDVGHVCQNLYLAVETVHAGMCAIAAYHQEVMDRLIGVDGQDEFAVYMAVVGKV